MESIRVEYEKEKCVGVKKCVEITPKYFSFNYQKADLINSEMRNGKYCLVLSPSQEELDKLILVAKSCPVNAIKIIDEKVNEDIVSTEVQQDEAKIIEAKYDDDKEFVLDPEGYFLIRIDQEKSLIEVGFCDSKNNVTTKIIGSKPIDIYSTIINKIKLPIRKDHCAYLGRELQKAYISLQKNMIYVQDDELKI